MVICEKKTTLRTMYILVFGIAISALVHPSASQRLTRAKCQEYGRYYKYFNDANDILPLIVGGAETDEREFPFMALIGFGKANVVWHCGGTLISERYVLSAAHCSSSKEYGDASRIKFGMSNQNQHTSNVQERRIVDVIIHPEYKRPQKYHDIALFHLNSPVRITSHVIPACLNYNKDIIWRHPTAVAIGFGKTSFVDDYGSEDLLKVELPILANSVCEPFYKLMKRTTLKNGLTEDMLCAGVISGGRDTCQGDSGGPLIVSEDYPVVLGITSFGKFCGYARSPAIYTKVYNYLPWIEKSAWRK